MSDDELFFQEDAVISIGEILLTHLPDRDALHLAYADLLDHYKKLSRQTKRLVRMNDRHQAELTQKTKELNLRNQFITKTFGRYMSDEIVAMLLESPEGLNLGGEVKLVTVVMTDLRGFSSISSSHPPEVVVGMLNDYLKEMTNIIFKYAGTVNEFIGDGILILFGAPITRPDDAARAIACAIEMQLAMVNVNASNRQKGFPELEMGIGINTGKVIAGNVGSDMRMKYTVVGSSVNLAARVESYTVGGQILATDSTLANIPPHAVRLHGDFLVPFKGVSKPVRIHNIIGINAPYDVSLPQQTIVYQDLLHHLTFNFEVLDGKHSYGKIWAGHIICLAEKSAIFISSLELAVHDNLKINLHAPTDETEDAHLYAKVLQCVDNLALKYEIHFTFLPEEVRIWLTQQNRSH
ncbi:MAG: adenylate/guanylate cyclase domain-containing protein [Gallionella sp.]|nr:adenylate/guanylate cyclase domain-containing protein [Gallionella sp.]